MFHLPHGEELSWDKRSLAHELPASPRRSGNQTHLVNEEEPEPESRDGPRSPSRGSIQKDAHPMSPEHLSGPAGRAWPASRPSEQRRQGRQLCLSLFCTLSELLSLSEPRLTSCACVRRCSRVLHQSHEERPCGDLARHSQTCSTPADCYTITHLTGDS